MDDTPWDPRFLDFDRPIAADDPTMVHLSLKTNLEPCLSSRDLGRIHSIINQVPALRTQLPRPGIRELVCSDGLPATAWRPQLLVGPDRAERRLLCAGCGTFKARSQMSACGRCKISFACGVKCQREAWPRHKVRRRCIAR